MKKLSLLVTTALLASITFVSCDQSKGGNVELKNQTDSISYAFGVVRTAGISAEVLNNDTAGAAYKAFVKGVNEGFKSKDSIDEKYAIGYQVGLIFKKQAEKGMMGDSTVKMNADILQQAIIASAGKKQLKMTEEEANKFLQSFFEKKQEETMLKQYGANKIAGEKFLADNKTKPGIITTASGLQYEIIKAGNGPKPEATSQVKVHYKGTLIDGKVFDSSYDRNEPAVFPVNQVIPAWTEAMQLMPVGSKWKLYVPQNLGYGARGGGEKIPPFSTLIFEVELLGIEK